MNSQSQNRRFIWSFARPLPAATVFGPLSLTRNRNFHLLHYGLLVTESAVENFIKSSVEGGSRGRDTTLGVLWELHGTVDRNTIRTLRPFTILNAKEEWGTFSARCVGTTTWTDAKIHLEGSP